MFGWFKPRCPVDPAAKRWIEERLHWLSEQFGRETFTRRALILPTNEFFPDPMDGTEASVRNLLQRRRSVAGKHTRIRSDKYGYRVDDRLVCVCANAVSRIESRVRLLFPRTNRGSIWHHHRHLRTMTFGAADSRTYLPRAVSLDTLWGTSRGNGCSLAASKRTNGCTRIRNSLGRWSLNRGDPVIEIRYRT